MKHNCEIFFLLNFANSEFNRETVLDIVVWKTYAKIHKSSSSINFKEYTHWGSIQIFVLKFDVVKTLTCQLRYLNFHAKNMRFKELKLNIRIFAPKISLKIHEFQYFVFKKFIFFFNRFYLNLWTKMILCPQCIM